MTKLTERIRNGVDSQQLYGTLDTDHCAFVSDEKGARLNPECAFVRQQLCLADRGFYVNFLQAGRRDLAQQAKQRALQQTHARLYENVQNHPSCRISHLFNPSGCWPAVLLLRGI